MIADEASQVTFLLRVEEKARRRRHEAGCKSSLTSQAKKMFLRKTKQLLPTHRSFQVFQVVFRWYSGGIQMLFRWYSGGIGKRNHFFQNRMVME